MGGKDGRKEGRRFFNYFFFVLVFGAHDALFALMWPHGCYVDEQARFYVYPSCVDDIQGVLV